ncbi:MAG: glutamate synthase subunit alpha, partial [Candidatus Omnitrophota bacterium]
MEKHLTKYNNFPKPQGLYDSFFEHDSCGVGFVCNIKGKRSNDIIGQGLEVLKRLAHRGATGADTKTGDGAGILIQLPHELFSSECEKEGIKINKEGEYGTGLVFLPQDKNDREFCKAAFKNIISQENQLLLGWRRVPLDDSTIGVTARDTAPIIEQVFIGTGEKNSSDGLNFERKLYSIRKQAENFIRSSNIKQKSFFYIVSLSSRTFIYKGLLMPDQVSSFFLDLKSPKIKSAL